MGYINLKTNCNLKTFDINKYKLYICDMDGTLYYQRKLQLAMVHKLLCYAIANPHNIWKCYAIYLFRKEREKDLIIHGIDGNENIDERIYKKLSLRLNKNVSLIEDVIKEWIYCIPIQYIAACKDIRLIDFLNNSKTNGKKVVILSDYQACEKVKVLNINTDAIYAATDENIKQLKPSTKGIEVILQDIPVDKKDILIIGDRFSKDAQMAIKAQIDYLILNKLKYQREKFHFY